MRVAAQVGEEGRLGTTRREIGAGRGARKGEKREKKTRVSRILAEAEEKVR